MLRSVQKVRQYKALGATGAYETGDGKGSENPVNCVGSNQVVFLLLARREAAGTTRFYVKVEWYAGGDSPYADAQGATVAKTEYYLDSTSGTLPTAPGEQGYAIMTPVRGRYARVSCKADWSSGAAPSVAVMAATGSTVGGEGQLLGRHNVRRSAAQPEGLGSLRYGDGAGGENPVNIRLADRVVLHIAANLGTGGTLHVVMDSSVDGASYYRETWYNPTATGSVEVFKKTYTIAVAEFGGADKDGYLALPVDVLGSWARFGFAAVTINAAHIACTALSGRV